METNHKHTTVDTKELVTTIAYLLGIKKHIVEQCFDSECRDLLQSLYQSQPATIIRYLCKLRTTLFLQVANYVISEIQENGHRDAVQLEKSEYA